MGRTFLRQVTQILNSDTYDDTVSPTEANFETNPSTIEGDLNNLRSAIKTLLGETNWWDTATRDIATMETDLADIEGKRVIGGVEVLTDITVPAAVKAQSTLTSTAIPNNGDTVTIGSQTYTFQTALVDSADNVAIGGTQAQAMENLRRAINDDGVEGTNYGTGTTANADVTATDTPTTVVATAIEAGDHKDSTATTETSSVMSWTGATLGSGTGGAGNQYTLVQASSETPSVAAAVGAGTALGAIVATLSGDVGSHDLAEVASTNTSVPKNRCLVRDASLHEGITDASGRQVYALLQAENGVVDGESFNDSTKQAQLSFVVIDDNDDLIPVDATDIGGQTVEYVYPRRYSIDTMPEDIGFPHFTFTDGGASVSVTLNNAIDNQGATAATQDTNIDWDLNTAGVELAFRDALAADLLNIAEGSAGGTSTMTIGAAVDVYQNDAVDVDFNAGITVDEGGTALNLGITAGQIDSAGALKVASGGAADLSLSAALELNLTDSYRSASTWSLADGISLADSSAEWTAFETAMEDILGSGNGEVSLLKAITEAAKNQRKAKVFAEVSTTITANNDASGPATDNNLDAELGDLSGGSFLNDYDVFVNGVLQEGGADAAANNDYYPGTNLANGQLKFEYTLTPNDKIAVISYA
jgi:hypothetical protein